MKRICIFIVLIFTNVVFAGVDLYGGMSLGNVSMNETNLGNQFAHSSTFFIGHFGFNLGIRPKLEFGGLGIGLIGEVGWVGDTLERRQINTNGAGNNRFESTRVIAGAHLGYAFGKSFGISAEYYPVVDSTITFSDNNANNPFRLGDKMKTTGYGIGMNYSWFDSMPAYVMYRRFSYKELQMVGAVVTLPSARYTSEFLVEDILAGIIKSF